MVQQGDTGLRKNGHLGQAFEARGALTSFQSTIDRGCPRSKSEREDGQNGNRSEGDEGNPHRKPHSVLYHLLRVLE